MEERRRAMMTMEKEKRLLEVCQVLDLPHDNWRWKELEDNWNEEYLFGIYLKQNDVEYSHKKEIKAKVKEFVTFIATNDPDFVKDARISYLNDEIIRLETLFLKYDEEKDLKKVNWLKRELRNWNNPGEYDASEITDEDIQAAKERDSADFVEIIRRDYDKQWARCPFHEEKTASFCCYPGDRGYHCYGCHAGGDTIDLVQRLYKKSFPEAIRFLIGK